METNLSTENQSDLKQAAEKLLAAAMNYWKVYRRVTGGAAVVWVSDVDGRLVILTRGEYRQVLMQNVDRLRDEARSENEPVIPFDLDEGSNVIDLREAAEMFGGIKLREIERLVILCSLERHDWSRKQVCQELGISARALYAKIQRFDLKRKQEESPIQ